MLIYVAVFDIVVVFVVVVVFEAVVVFVVVVVFGIRCNAKNAFAKLRKEKFHASGLELRTFG